MVPLLMPGAAQACSAWAEKVVAWDGAADLAVVAIWTERDRPPTGRAAPSPDQYELRRLSSGQGLTMFLCPVPEGAAAEPRPDCQWRGAFPGTPAEKATFERRGTPLPRGRVRVTASSSKGATTFALEARSRGKWQRLQWLDNIATGYPERRRYQVLNVERWGDDVVLILDYHSRGGNCRHTAVRAWRMPAADLDAPADPARQSRLLEQVRQDAPLGYWRTVAELGPVPADRLLAAMEAAEAGGRSDLAVRWWQEAVPSIPAARLATLREELKRHAGLSATRPALLRSGSAAASP